MKTYYLMIATTFPKGHKRQGEKTDFPYAIKYYDKLHTIRDNYKLWAYRIAEVNAGRAVLSLRIWENEPYRSKQLEIFRFDMTHQIGIEKIEANPLGWVINDNLLESLSTVELAKNDGLSLSDFESWFKGKFDQSHPKAIIHFTNWFRYST